MSPIFEAAFRYRGELRFLRFGYTPASPQFGYSDGGDDLPSDERLWSWFLNHPVISSHLPENRYPTLYGKFPSGTGRTGFRNVLAQVIRSEAAHYGQPSRVLDAEHCDAIRRICDGLSSRFGHIFLTKRRLRYGTAQKAFNLYLKFLWRLGQLGTGKPPHCPVDGIVLGATGWLGKWTHSDDQQEYVRWIEGIRKVAVPLDLSDWEYEIWQRRQVAPVRKQCG